MKEIIPFKKKLTFDTNVNEITSIALENSLGVKENLISGDLIINGTYKITESSIKIDNFEFKIPIDIDIDEKYILENITIDIDDFYYEIINNNILEVNIDIKIDNLNKKIIEEPKQEEKRCIEEEKIKIDTKQKNENIEPKKEEMQEKNIIENINEEEYSTYYVYIVRAGDTLETILTKYNIKRENIQEYNDISELKIGDKLIIPISNA